MDKHPSGMTWDRWRAPFKTPEERELVIRFNRKQDRKEAKQSFEAFYSSLPEAPF